VQFEEALNTPDPKEGLQRLIDPALGEDYPIDPILKVRPRQTDQYNAAAEKTSAYKKATYLVHHAGDTSINKAKINSQLALLQALYFKLLQNYLYPLCYVRTILSLTVTHHLPFWQMTVLARACTQEDPKARPTMRSIVVALMTLSSTSEFWDMNAIQENQGLVNLMSGR